MDDQQRAREFLTSAWVEAGWTPEAAAVLASGNDTSMNVQLSAITAALRAAPDGFVLVPVEPTVAMQVAALGKSWTVMFPKSVWAAMLAARPQGVK